MGGWSEQRLEPRVDYRAPVKVMSAGETRQTVAQSLNLSPRGILVDTPAPYPVGTEIVCDVSLPTGSKTLRGRVVRVQPLSPSSTGVAIVFVDLSPSDLSALRRLVEGQAGTEWEEQGQGDGQQLAVRVSGTTWLFRGNALLKEDGYYLNVPLPFLRLDSAVELAASPSAPVITRALVKGITLEPLGPDGVPRLRIAVRIAGNGGALVEEDVVVDPGVANQPPTPEPQFLISEETSHEPTEVTPNRQSAPGDLADRRRDIKARGLLTLVAGLLLAATGAAIALYTPPGWLRTRNASAPSTSPTPATASPAALGAPQTTVAPTSAPAAATGPQIVPVTVPLEGQADKPRFEALPDRFRATIAIRGSLQNERHYALVSPPGLAVNLPHARALAPFGRYRTAVRGFREVWINPLHGGGIHLRFLFSAPFAKDPQVDLAPGSVAVSLPAPRLASKPPR
ncbi:MAG TPA: PilZ domain-containing protein [Polyangia bacterium]|nr:PilZ domain-containing protein [Polyangia bacterium]